MVQLRRTAANAAAYDLDCELLTPEQALEHYPVMRVDDLVGAIWLPADGKANPTDLTQALAKGARLRGARVVEKTRVTRCHDARTAGSPGCAPTPATSRPRSWSTAPASGPSRSGAMAGVNVPLHSAEHFYVVTEHHRRRAPRPADPARPRRLHLLQGGGRRPGHRRLRAGGQAVGVAGRDPVPVRVPAAGRGLGPLPDPDGQRAAADPGAGGRPGSRSSTTARRASPPTTSSSSARRPSCANFFVGAGFNSVGIASAGGAGRALAEWIVNGAPTTDLTGVDIRRFAPFNGNNRVAARPGRRDPRACTTKSLGPTGK